MSHDLNHNTTLVICGPALPAQLRRCRRVEGHRQLTCCAPRNNLRTLRTVIPATVAPPGGFWWGGGRSVLPATVRRPRGRGGKGLVHTGSCRMYDIHTAFEHLRGGEIVLAPERRARFLHGFLNATDLVARRVKHVPGQLRGFGGLEPPGGRGQGGR